MYACSTSSFSLTGVTGIVNSLVNHSSFSLTGVTDVPLLLYLLDSPTALFSTPSVSDVSIHIPVCCSSGYGPCALCSTVSVTVSLRAHTVGRSVWGLIRLAQAGDVPHV